MKIIVGAAIAAAAIALAGSSWAEPYQDYTPQKGAWQIQEIHVDPNHIDDYLTGLKTAWVPGQEIAKKHGLVDIYTVLVRIDSGTHAANVMLATHYTSLTAFEPDKARDQAMEQENYAAVSKDKGAALVSGFEKYRTFVGDGIYQVMEFTK
jgi:hypothetical protein